jgi:ankyrin repeat protein
MMSRSLSRAVLLGGIGAFFLVLAGCKSNPPAEDDVWTLIDRGESLKAQEFFRSRIDVRAVDRLGRTPLHAAAEAGDSVLAAFLIALGADVNAEDNHNPPRTPLVISAERLDYTTARILVTHGANIHQPSPSKRSPALIAFNTEKEAAAIRADQEQRRKDWETTRKGAQAELAKDSQERGRIFAKRLSVQERLVLETTVEQLEALIKNLPDETGLRLEELNDRRGEFFRAILTENSIQNTDKNGQTVLHLAVNFGDPGAVSTILGKSKTALNAADGEENTALDLALALGTDSLVHAKIAQDLILAGARPANLSPELSGFYEVFVRAITGKNYNLRLAGGNTPLHDTARLGYIGFAQLFLGEEPDDTNDPADFADPMAKNISGATPLHEAVRWGRLDMIRLLIEEGADVNVQDAKGNAPLHIAVNPPDSHREVIRTLLENGADPTLQDAHGETPLHIAVILGRSAEVIESLIDEDGLALSTRNIDGKTPLYLAVEIENRAGLIPSLLDKSDIFAADNGGRTPLERALGDYSLENKETAALSKLITPSTARQSDSGGNTPLHIAIKNGANIAAVSFILDNRAPVNARNREGDTGLHLAVRQDHREAGKLLLARDANIFASNERGESPLYLSFHSPGGMRGWMFDDRAVFARKDGLGNGILHYAAGWKQDTNTQIRSLVRDKGLPVDDKNASGETPLFWAVRADLPDTIQTLLEERANLGARDRLGNTVLHAAVRQNAVNAAQTLLNADPALANSQNLEGRSPLHDAAQLGITGLVKLLEDYRADIEIRDKEGNTPLMAATSRGAIPAVELLANTYRADPSTSNAQGDTPLHVAIRNDLGLEAAKQDELIQVLLSGGASIHIKNGQRKQGQSPFQLALNQTSPEISRRLVALLLAGDRVYIPDDKGASPLHIAIREGVSHYMIEQIFSQGQAARLVAVSDAEGITPLRIAVDKNDWRILAKYLVERGADVFFRAGDGMTPADFALRQGGEAIEALFFDPKTTGARDKEGNTILHYAAQRDDPAMISLLISKGADPLAVNIVGENPGDIARRLKRNRVAALLPVSN